MELVNVEGEMERYAVDKSCRQFIVSCLLDLLHLHSHHLHHSCRNQPSFHLPMTPVTAVPITPITPASPTLSAPPTHPTAKGASEQVVSEQVSSEARGPYRLAELAEVLLVESTAATNGMNPIECAHLDRLYLTHGSVQGGLHLGPGILALAVAVAMQSLPSLWPDDVAEIAEFLEEMGCEEAGYRARVRVLGSVYATEADCKEVIRRTVGPRGVEPVRRRIQRVVGVAETALTQAPTEASRSAYVRRFCDALMDQLLLVLPEALPEAWPEPAPRPPPRSLSGGGMREKDGVGTELFSPPPLSCPASLPASSSLPNGFTATGTAAAAAAVAAATAVDADTATAAAATTTASTNHLPKNIIPMIPDSEAAPTIPWVRDLAEAYLRLSRHLSLDSEGVRQQHERHTDVCACIILRCLVAEVAREREEARVAAAAPPDSRDAAGSPGSACSAAASDANGGGVSAGLLVAELAGAGAAGAAGYGTTATEAAVNQQGNSVVSDSKGTLEPGASEGKESSSRDAQQEREERDAAMAALLLHLDKAPGGTGSLAWKAIGRMLERRNPNHPVLPAVWVRAVLNTHLAVNEEGTGTDVDSLELFDWSLESLLVTLPMGPEAAASLLQIIDSAVHLDSSVAPDSISAVEPSAPLLSNATRVDVLLAIAARVACTIYWRWARRRDAPRFVAQLLTLAHGTVGMSPEQLQRALKIGERLWGWTMPSPASLQQRCETPEEAREIRESCIISAWYSTSAFRGEEPIELIGAQWPYR
ncbi:hypothetical protein CLOP_g1030 [Closterium sp. NIES-67]|nr:hypothetical protein CLOP_g1030 [Closterium sp. NIES-67]